MIGIYGIRNKVTDQIYIGKTRNFSKRFIRHRYLLKANKHFNKYLQNSYNKYGVGNFEFIELEKCSIENLTLTEQKLVNNNEHRLFNHVKDVIKLCGPENPFYGHKHSEEAKIKMSLAKQDKYDGEANPNYGKKQTLETIKSMIKNNSQTKLTTDHVINISKDLKENKKSHAEIAKEYNISRTVITRISNGSRWSIITGIPFVNKTRKGSKLSESHKIRIGNSHKGMKYKTKDKI